MSNLLLAFALVAATDSGSQTTRGPEERVTCSVEVRGVDALGRRRPTRSLSASVVPGVAFRGRLSEHDEAQPVRLVFDVYNPGGLRYQALLGTPVAASKRRDRPGAARVSRVREAALSVAGSSIAWTSMYGRWKVVPRIEGEQEACGSPKYFTIRP